MEERYLIELRINPNNGKEYTFCISWRSYYKFFNTHHYKFKEEEYGSDYLARQYFIGKLGLHFFKNSVF